MSHISASAIAQTIVLNCTSFVFEFDHFFMFISHLYFLISSLCLILGVGEIVVSYFKELIYYWEKSFGLSSITDLFYTPLNFIFVIRMCMIVTCPSISTFALRLLSFMSFGKDIYTESIKPSSLLTSNYFVFFLIQILKS